MTTARSLYPLVFFVSGLGFGVFWSPLERPNAADSRDLSDVRSENDEFVERMGELYGEETAEFVRQFEDMTIRIHEFPIDACASPDGRFVIRLFESNETIASDLRHPDTEGTVKQLVRHYSFSSGGQTYTCDFVRNIDTLKVTRVHFSFTDAEGRGLTYMDSDGDGRWDGLSDRTREPPVFYERDGLRWREREKDTSNEPPVAP